MHRKRITLWIISLGLVVAINGCVFTGQGEVAKYLGLALVGVGMKLAESEEKGP